MNGNFMSSRYDRNGRMRMRPPNLARRSVPLESYAFTENEDTLFVHLFMGSNDGKIGEWENGKRADGIRYAMGRKHKDPCAG